MSINMGTCLTRASLIGLVRMRYLWISRRSSLRATGPVAVLRHDVKRLPKQEPTFTKENRLGPVLKCERDQGSDLSTPRMLPLSKWSYLCSTCRPPLAPHRLTKERDEVQRRYTATCLGQGENFVDDLQFHDSFLFGGASLNGLSTHT